MDDYIYILVGGGCRVHRLLFCRGLRPPVSILDITLKQSNDKVPVILEVWGMWNTPSLLSLPGPLWPGVVAPDMVLSIGLIELNYVLMLN